MTAVDMGRRYIVAFMNKGEGANSISAEEKGLEADDNNKKELSGEEDVSSQKEGEKSNSMITFIIAFNTRSADLGLINHTVQLKDIYVN